jgi:hypothetical protein
MATWSHKEWQNYSTQHDDFIQVGYVYCWNPQNLKQKFWAILKRENGQDIRTVQVGDSFDSNGLAERLDHYKPNSWSSQSEGTEPMGEELDEWLSKNNFVMDLPPVDLSVLQSTVQMYF